jgi:hypothetical protein
VMQHQHIGRPMQRVRIRAVRRESMKCQMVERENLFNGCKQ